MMPPILEAFLQAWITLTAIAALLMFTLKGRWACWAPLVGLIGQPAWIWSTFFHGQYGMFVVSLAFTLIYTWGVWREWIAPMLEQPEI